MWTQFYYQHDGKNMIMTFFTYCIFFKFSYLKLQHFDRVVVEAESGEVVLEGLDQSYHAIFHFLRWILS